MAVASGVVAQAQQDAQTHRVQESDTAQIGALAPSATANTCCTSRRPDASRSSPSSGDRVNARRSMITSRGAWWVCTAASSARRASASWTTLSATCRCRQDGEPRRLSTRSAARRRPWSPRAADRAGRLHPDVGAEIAQCGTSILRTSPPAAPHGRRRRDRCCPVAILSLRRHRDESALLKRSEVARWTAGGYSPLEVVRPERSARIADTRAARVSRCRRFER